MRPGGISCAVLAPKPTGGSTAPAFERLYRRHVAEVYRYAAAMLPNSADAEDVVQTTFLNAFRAFEQGQRPRHPLSWLMAIAHNVCRQRFRQQSRRPTEVAFEDDLPAVGSDDETVSMAEVRRALGQLGFNQRTALVMRELEGRSYAEIAERLGLSRSAVETLIFRARRALREQLDGTLTCHQAGQAISRQLDGLLARHERGALRAHLRCCRDCRLLARRMRGRRSAIKALGALPLPASLTAFSAAGARVAAGIGVRAPALKLAAAATAAFVAAGAGYEAVRTPAPWPPVPAARPGRAVAIPAAPTVHVAPPPSSTRRHTPARPAAAVAASPVQPTQTPTPAPPAATRPEATTTMTTTPSRRVQAGRAGAPPARDRSHGRPADLGKSHDASASHTPPAGDTHGGAPACTPLPACVPQVPAPPDAHTPVGSAQANAPAPPSLPHE
jgi:RNA polymerase sigma factor (sigma-70 family)